MIPFIDIFFESANPKPRKVELYTGDSVLIRCGIILQDGSLLHPSSSDSSCELWIEAPEPETYYTIKGRIEGALMEIETDPSITDNLPQQSNGWITWLDETAKRSIRCPIEFCLNKTPAGGAPAPTPERKWATLSDLDGFLKNGAAVSIPFPACNFSIAMETGSGLPNFGIQHYADNDGKVTLSWNAVGIPSGILQIYSFYGWSSYTIESCHFISPASGIHDAEWSITGSLLSIKFDSNPIDFSLDLVISGVRKGTPMLLGIPTLTVEASNQ